MYKVVLWKNSHSLELLLRNEFSFNIRAVITGIEKCSLIIPVFTMKSYICSGGRAPIILSFSTRWAWVVIFMPWLLYPPPTGTAPLLPTELGGSQFRGHPARRPDSILTVLSQLQLRVWVINKVTPLTCLCRHRGEMQVQLLSIHNLALEGAVWSAPCSGCFTPRKDTVPIVQESGWALGPVLTAWKILPPPGFNPQTIQPVAGRYNDYAVPATWVINMHINNSHRWHVILWHHEDLLGNGGKAAHCRHWH